MIFAKKPDVSFGLCNRDFCKKNRMFLLVYAIEIFGFFEGGGAKTLGPKEFRHILSLIFLDLLRTVKAFFLNLLGPTFSLWVGALKVSFLDQFFFSGVSWTNFFLDFFCRFNAPECYCVTVITEGSSAFWLFFEQSSIAVNVIDISDNFTSLQTLWQHFRLCPDFGEHLCFKNLFSVFLVSKDSFGCSFQS